MSVIQLSDYPWLGKQVLSTTLVDSVMRPQTLGIEQGILRRPNGKATLVNDGVVVEGGEGCKGKVEINTLLVLSSFSKASFISAF